MADLPYPFSRDNGRYYLVALGNGEYIRVVLSGDYDHQYRTGQHQYRMAEAWMFVARQLLQQLNPTARLDEIVTEADQLFIDAYRGD